MIATDFRLQHAVRALHAGGVIAYPTEAVWGLGCDPANADAVIRILMLKQRPMHKGLIIIAADLEQLKPWIAPLPKAATMTLLQQPITWIVPAQQQTPRCLRGNHDSIAVRLTKHPLAAALCRAAGHALVSTSANISQRPPARTALGVRMRFRKRLDYVLNGAVGSATKTY